jgi:hypothetical protein
MVGVSLMRNKESLDGGAYLLGNNLCSCGVGTGQDGDELLAAEAGEKI